MRILPYLITTTLFILPAIVSAQGGVYAPLVDLGNAGQGNEVQSFEQYINFLYGMSIAVAALLAVIKIIIAGTKYMLSDVISNKGEALKDIQGAILGLLLILSAVIILELINPQLTEKSISFPGFQSERGAVSSPGVNTPGGTLAGASSAIENQVTEALNVGCGVTTRQNTEQNFVWTLDASTCTDPGAALGAFSRGCMGSGGQLSSGRAAELISSCSVPRTGLNAGGRTAQIEFVMDGYDANFNLCTFAWLIPILNITTCSQEAELSEDDIDRQASVGATIVYDAEKNCRDEMADSYEDEFLETCVETIEELLFENCTVYSGSLCDSGWCLHNAGQRVNGAGLRKFSCQLPYQRFTKDEVLNKYREITPTAQQGSTVTEEVFRAGCQGLQGTYVYIALNSSSGDPDDFRCVKR